MDVLTKARFLPLRFRPTPSVSIFSGSPQCFAVDPRRGHAGSDRIPDYLWRTFRRAGRWRVPSCRNKPTPRSPMMNTVRSLAARSGKGDVAEPRRRQRGDREIERVDIGAGTRLVLERHNERPADAITKMKTKRLDSSEDRILVQPEEPALASEITKSGDKELDQAQSAQDYAGRQGRRLKIGASRSEATNDKIGDRVKPQAFLPAVFRKSRIRAARSARISTSETGVDRGQDCGLRPRHAQDEVDDSQRVEDDQRIAEPFGPMTATGIEQPGRTMQFLHAI